MRTEGMRLIACVLLLATGTLAPCYAQEHASGTLSFTQLFTRSTSGPEVTDDRYSEGSSWADINNDGYLDLFVPDLWGDKQNLLFVNNGNGSFHQITNDPVVTDFSQASGGSFGDFDNDGDLDLFVQNYFGDNNHLYLNDGHGNFSKVTTGAIVNDGGYSFGSTVVDYDVDGDLDIYVSNGAFRDQGENNFLYANNGDGSFTRILEGPLVNDSSLSNSPSWCDFDNDGDLDLFVPTGGSFDPIVLDNFFYLNNGDGSFTRILEGDVIKDGGNAVAGSWGDYDNDGDFDLFIAQYAGKNNTFYENNGNGTFTKITEGILVNDGGHSVSGAWGDYDNDGDLDLFVTNDNNQNNALYENLGDGSFTKLVVEHGGRSNGVTWADVNNDGYLDAFVPNGNRPVTQHNELYLNKKTFDHTWINLKLVGTTSNRTAIGAKVRAKATINGQPVWQLRQVSGQTGFNAQNSFNVEFGFGDATQIDSLIIEWPLGLVDIYEQVDVNRFLVITEGQTLSPVSREHADTLPRPFALAQNYPNPFREETHITFEVPQPAWVSLTVYDMLGRAVRVLIEGKQPGGTHTVIWDGNNEAGSPIPPGIYFYQIQVGPSTLTKEMVRFR